MNICVAAILRKDDKFLMMYHKKLGAVSPPGGKVEGNETPLFGAIREIKEEIGIDVLPSDLLLCNVMVTNADDTNYILYTYLVTDWENSKSIEPENVEYEKHSQFDWYTIEQIKDAEKITTSAEVILHGYKAFDEFMKEYKSGL